MPDFNVGENIASMELTYSWGLSPASASVTCPGEVTATVGDAAVMNLGGMTFHGIVSQNPVSTTLGKMTELQLVDNRIRLMWDDIYGSWNNSEVREDNPATPGIDRQKRFWHVLEDNWDAQIKTWTDAPYSASEILDMIVGNAARTYTWSLSKHSAQDKPVYAIDALNGSKVGTVLQEISEQQGLVFTLLGENTLVWVRKGDGSIDAAPDNSNDLKDGDALSNNDTHVRIVGDRNRYQDLPITLEPDWVAAYEPFWAEPAWLKEVADKFSLLSTDLADQAELVAKSRSVTVRDYSAVAGVEFEDPGTWGEVGRMEIPVWVYLTDIVWKAYRIPPGYAVNGIPRANLELNDGLLAAVDYDIESGALSYKSPFHYYPDAKAFVVAQGQPIDLLDPRTQGAITPEQLDTARDLWSAQNRFNLDVKNYSLVFEHAVFRPGTGTGALFTFPNRELVEAGDPLYNIAVPNAGVEVTAAAVQGSFVFSAERYSKRYGSGVRSGAKYVSSLNYHALMDAGTFQSEIPYADNKTVDDKAGEYALVLTAQQAIYRTGGYTRHGAVGTVLSSTIDRVTVSLNFGDALTERVEYSKERAQSNFQHERELDRKSKERDLFPGQKNNVKDVERLNLIAKLSRELKRTSVSPYASASDIMTRPVGGARASVAIHDVGTADAPADAGELVWTAGTADSDPKSFAGVVVAQGSSTHAACVTHGTVPVRVKGPFKPGDVVGGADGDKECTADATLAGWHSVGAVMANYAGTDTVLAPVQLGGGGQPPVKGTKVGFYWYHAAYTGGGDPPPDQGLKIGILSSVINADIVPDNVAAVFTLANNATQYLQCTTTQDAAGTVTGATLAVTPSMVPDSEGTLGVAPATSSRALWQFKTQDNKIVQDIALRIGGLDVVPRVYNMSCGQVSLKMFWGTAAAADQVIFLDEVTPP